jgi:hypothetical protein
VTVYHLVEAFVDMRSGKRPNFPVPRSFSYRKAHCHINRSKEDAYAALWGFRIKHPDSKRQPRARQRSIDFRAARNLGGSL